VALMLHRKSSEAHSDFQGLRAVPQNRTTFCCSARTPRLCIDSTTPDFPRLASRIVQYRYDVHMS
jgi:hypothetical protein